MKKLILAIFLFLFTSVSAMAEYTIYLPTKPGSGLDQWAQVVIKELKNINDWTVPYNKYR